MQIGLGAVGTRSPLAARAQRDEPRLDVRDEGEVGIAGRGVVRDQRAEQVLRLA